MTELVVRQPADADRLSTDQLKYLASTSFVPSSYRGKLPEIMACVATGREYGLGDMESLRLIDVVDGRPTLRAEAMVKLIRRRGHSITADYGEGRVTVNGKRADNGDEISVTWTMSMAKRAGLDEKKNWTRYPEAMLWARAVSQLCRMLFADALGGLAYTADEVELDQDERLEQAAGDLPVVSVEAFEEIDENAPPSFDSGSGETAASGTSEADAASAEEGRADSPQLFTEPSEEQHANARRKRETGEA